MDVVMMTRVDDAFYDYGAINKAALEQTAKDDPAYFTFMRTWSIQATQCAVQTQLESPRVTSEQRAQGKFVIRLLDEWAAIMAEINAAGLGYAELVPEGVKPYMTDMDRLLTSPGSTRDFLIKVPKTPALPFGPVCPLFGDGFDRAIRVDAKKNWPAWLSYRRAFGDVMDFYNNHRDQWLLYMRIHPEEFNLAMIGVEDMLCTTRKTPVNPGPINNNWPRGCNSREDCIVKEDAWLTALRGIEWDSVVVESDILKGAGQ